MSSAGRLRPPWIVAPSLDGVKETRDWQADGTTKTVTIPLTARRTADMIAVQGLEPVTFSDYDINDRSGGPASVGNTGQLEFVLQFGPRGTRDTPAAGDRR